MIYADISKIAEERMRKKCLNKIQMHRKSTKDQVEMDSGWEAACIVVMAAIKSIDIKDTEREIFAIMR